MLSTNVYLNGNDSIIPCCCSSVGIRGKTISSKCNSEAGTRITQHFLKICSDHKCHQVDGCCNRNGAWCWQHDSSVTAVSQVLGVSCGRETSVLVKQLINMEGNH